MSKTFRCVHCQRRYKKNPRLKGQQKYCGSKSCQQSRKNRWEREKLSKDSEYRARRRESKKRWYSRYPGDRYQNLYRDSHPDYLESNRKKQQKRNKPAAIGSGSAKIVKTDALTSESVIRRGLYVLLPYKKTDVEKIVKTDALIVQLLDTPILEGNFLLNSS